MKIAVIGGGVLGMAAAYELLKQGQQVALYERAPVLGGQVRTFDVGGGRLECFYHHLFTSDVDMIDLIHDLGLSDNLTWIPSRMGFFHGGRIHNFVTPMDLLRFSPISIVDRVRLGLLALYLGRFSNWEKLEGVPAQEWITRYAGKRISDVVWGPLLRGKFGDAAREVGMVWFWGKVFLRFSSRKGGRETLGYPKGSFGTIIEALERRIRDMGGEVHAPAQINRIVVEDGRAVGLELGGEGGPTVRRFDRVLATVPSYVFPRLAPELPAAYLEKLQRVRYHTAFCLILVMKRPLSHIYWLNVADRTIPFVAAIEQTNFMPPEQYGGKHIVYLSNYLPKTHPLYAKNADEMFQEFLPHLRRINSQFDPSWVEEMHLFKDEAGQPIITTNYLKQIPEHRTPFRDLWLANTTQVYPEDRGTNYSVRLARKVVILMLRDAGLDVPAKMLPGRVPRSLVGLEREGLTP